METASIERFLIFHLSFSIPLLLYPFSVRDAIRTDRRLDKVHYFLKGAAWREYFGYADFFEFCDVAIGDDTSREEDDILDLLFAYEVHDSGEQVHMGPR